LPKLFSVRGFRSWVGVGEARIEAGSLKPDARKANPTEYCPSLEGISLDTTLQNDVLWPEPKRTLSDEGLEAGFSLANLVSMLEARKVNPTKHYSSLERTSFDTSLENDIRASSLIKGVVIW
jgi:hypothetical protein